MPRRPVCARRENDCVDNSDGIAHEQSTDVNNLTSICAASCRRRRRPNLMSIWRLVQPAGKKPPAQGRIDRLLAEGTAAIEPVPVALASRIDVRIRTVRRRRVFAWAGAMSTAAAILLAVGLWATQNNFVPQRGGSPNGLRSTVVDDHGWPTAPPAAVARVTMIDPSSAIVVPMESHSPNVTVVCIYPTIRTNRENNRQSAE